MNGLKKKKEEIIRNYIDSSKVFKRRQKKKVNLPYVENDINFLIVCRLVEQKALDRFIKVQKRIRK